MRIIIVGPGALGCLLSSLICKAREPDDTVILLDYNVERAGLINSQGIIYEKDGQQTNIPIDVHSDPAQLADADVVFLCVKSYDVAKSIEYCRPILHPSTLLVFLQNGIAHLPFDGGAGEAATAFGTTTEGATNLGPGRVRHAGEGQTFLGFLQPPSARHADILTDIVTKLQQGGTKADISSDILTRIWQKLVINVGINALTVIHDCRNGELLAIDEALQQMNQALEETKRLAQAKRIPITSSMADIKAVCNATAENVSSMLQDIRKGRRTEIDAINGAVVNAAKELGIATPANFNLVERVREIEALQRTT